MISIDEAVKGKYKIIRKIGQGGMGTVYLADCLSDGNTVAIKENTLNDRNRTMVLREVEIQSSLNHPAIPRVVECIRNDNAVYIVMEYVRGRTLKDMVEEGGAFPEGVVLDWFIQICNVLEYIHSLPNPIAYRDLKPENIIVQRDGRLSIIDFGIAEEYRETNPKPKKYVALTKGYAAPEQYSSQYTFDVRTDIYSLGATMHYLLTGKNPQKPPYKFEPVRKLKKDATRAIEYIIRRCLEPNPDKRYGTIDSLLFDLCDTNRLNDRLKRNNTLKILTTVCVGLFLAATGVFVYQGAFEYRKYEINTHAREIANVQELIDSGDYSAADASLNELMGEYENDESLYLMRAELYMKRDGEESAIQYIGDEVLTRFDGIYDNPEFLAFMGKLYNKSGNKEMARYYYEMLYDKNYERMDEKQRQELVKLIEEIK